MVVIIILLFLEIKNNNIYLGSLLNCIYLLILIFYSDEYFYNYKLSNIYFNIIKIDLLNNKYYYLINKCIIHGNLYLINIKYQ